MSANEQLGIELKVTDNTAVNTMEKLLATIKGIQDALKGLGVENLQKAMDGIGKATSNLSAGSKAFADIKTGSETAAKAVDQLNKAIASPNTWKEFMKQNMSAYMQLEGSHKAAMSKMGADWQEYKKQSVSAVEEVITQVSRKMSLMNIKALEIDASKSVSRSAYTPSKYNPADDNAHVVAYAKRQDAMLAAEIKVQEEKANISRKIAAEGARLEKADIDARINASKIAMREAATKEDQMNAMFRLDKATKEKEALRARLADIKRAIADELAEEKKKVEQINAMHLKSVAENRITPIKAVDPITGALFAREQQDKILNVPVSANPFKDMVSSLTVVGTTVEQVRAKLASFGIDQTKITSMGASDFQKLAAAVKPFGVSIDRATGAVQELKKKTDEVKNGFFSFLPDTLGRMAARLTEFYSIRTVIFAVSSQLRDAATAAVDFNQNIHDIIAISGESRDGMQGIGQSIWDIAEASRFSAKEVADLMQVLAQAGVKSAQLPDVAKSVGIFATGAGADPKLAADLFTTSMNVFEIKAENAMRITNALTAALNNSKLEASGLATAFNYLAPQAAQLGMSLESTLGIISTMAQSGVKASTIGTGVSQMLKEFAAPKGRLKNLLEYYGLTPENINPLKHSFAEIVDSLNNAKGKAGETGVAVSHLFSALESRVGRSAIAAINLGGDAFRNMENSVTGTSAALLAYEKSMEGARARMNVLKQIFHEFISDSLSKLAPMFIVVTQSLRGFLNVMNTEGGKFIATGMAMVSTIGALAIAAKALSTWAATSTLLKGGGLIASILGGIGSAPVLAIVATLALVTAGIVGVGYALDRNKQKEEEAKKKTLEATEARQKMLDVINSVRVSMERTNPELKKYQELLLTQGEQDSKVIALGNTKVKLTTDQTSELKKLIAKYPELFTGMDTELEKVSGLTNAYTKLNRAKFGKSEDAATEYNSKLDEAKRTYDKEMARLRKLGPVVDPTNNKAINEYRETVGGLGDLRDEIYSSSFSRPVRGVDKNGKSIIETGVQSFIPVSREEVPGVPISRPVLVDRAEKDLKDLPGEFDPSAKKGKGEAAAARVIEKQQDLVDKYITHVKEVATEAVVAGLKSDLEFIKEGLADKNNQSARTRLLEEAKKVIDQEREINLEKSILSESQKYADMLHYAVGFNAKKNSFYYKDRPKDPAQAAQYDEAVKADKKLYPEYKNLVESKKIRFSEEAETEYAKLAAKPAKEPKLPKDTTMREEKMEGMRLEKVLFELNARKEMASTAEQIKDIDIEILATQEESAKKVKHIYDTWKKTLDDQPESVKATEEWKMAMMGVGDSLEAIDLKIKGINLKLNDQKESGLGYNFAKGFDKAVISLGTFKSNYEALGNQIGNDIFGGLNNTLNQTLDTWTKPESDQVKGIKQEIADLNKQKAELEGNIASASAGGFRTPEQSASLANQKIQLQGVNEKLAEQSRLLKENTNGWSRFRDGLSKLLASVADTVQKMVVQLVILWAWQKLVGFATSSAGPANISESGGLSSGTPSMSNSANYNLLNTKQFAEGGMIPLSAGQAGVDSVPIMSMPGEIVIKKSSVDAIGPEKLLWANEHGKLPKFAAGGMVGGNRGSGNFGGDGQEFTLQIVNVADINSIPPQPVDAQQVINIVAFDAQNRGTTHKAIKMVMQN